MIERIRMYIPGSCLRIAIVSCETVVEEEEEETSVADVMVAVVNDCSCVIVSVDMLGGDEEDDDDDEVVVVVSNETLRCSVEVGVVVISSLPAAGDIFFLFGVVVDAVDGLMT